MRTRMRIGSAGSVCVGGVRLRPQEDFAMKLSPFHILVPVCLVVAGSAAATSPKPRISMQAARAKAMKIVHHGTIRSSELETEHGNLLYSFDIKLPGKPGVEEVQISAIDGRLLSRKYESPNKEKAEARAEAHDKKRS